MTVNMQFKRGNKSNLPSSALSGTPLWCEDTKEFFIGTGSSVHKINNTSQAMKILSTQGTISLEDNSINNVSVSGAITFQLPTINDNTIFHQILVQLNMQTVQTINLGTTYYFNQTAPDLSNAGYYNLIYEYDLNLGWVVGAIAKGIS